MKTPLKPIQRLLLLSLIGLQALAQDAVLRDHGLPNEQPFEVLPDQAIVHLQLNNPQRILLELEEFIKATVPEKLLPPELQGLSREEHPVLTLLGMQTIQAPLTRDELAARTGLDVERPITVSLYAGMPQGSFIVSLPIADHAVFTEFLRHTAPVESFASSSIGGKSFLRVALKGGGPLTQLVLAASEDRVYVAGQESLLMLLYSDSEVPRLSESHVIPEMSGFAQEHDLWFAFNPSLLKPLLPQFRYFEYLPLQMLLPQLDEFIKNIPPEQRVILQQRICARLGIGTVEEFVAYVKVLATATYEEVFDALVDNLESFHGFGLALRADAQFPQASFVLFSDEFEAEAKGRPVPVGQVKQLLSRLPDSPNHITALGQKAPWSPSPRFGSWFQRVKSGLEAHELSSEPITTWAEMFSELRQPGSFQTRVPWMVRARMMVNPPPRPEDYDQLAPYLVDLASGVGQPMVRPIILVPRQSDNIFLEVLEETQAALEHNREVVQSIFPPNPVLSALVKTERRLDTVDLDQGVQQITWATSLLTRGGLFGFNEHELISRRIYFTRQVGDYTVFHQSSQGPEWISDFEFKPSGRLAPGLEKLMAQIPEDVNGFCIHRFLNQVPDVIDWLVEFEDLLHRDVESCLNQARELASEADDADDLKLKLARLEFSPLVYSINRDPESGEIYCLLPGGVPFPRPEVTPLISDLLGDFRQQADDLGGGWVMYCRTQDGRWDGSVLLGTEALSTFLKTVGNSAAEYVGNPEKMRNLQKKLVSSRDMKGDRFEEILVQNPFWAFLPPQRQVQVRTAGPSAPKPPAQPQQPIAPRSPDADKQHIDLSDFYNSSLKDNWHASGTTGNDLSSLPQGVQELGGTRFDVRGIVQLSGRSPQQQSRVEFPQQVSDIPVKQTCEKLHFLHATGWTAPDGTRIGSYTVHYVDGQTTEIPIVYGQHVRDWWATGPNRDVSDSEVVWKGNNAATRSANVGLQLYKTTWENPRPGVPIASIDYRSAMSDSAPFLIAVTAE